MPLPDRCVASWSQTASGIGSRGRQVRGRRTPFARPQGDQRARTRGALDTGNASGYPTSGATASTLRYTHCWRAFMGSIAQLTPQVLGGLLMIHCSGSGKVAPSVTRSGAQVVEDAAPTTCAQRTMDSSNAIAAAAQQAEADLSCRTDSDCIIAANSTICWNGCGELVNRAGAAQLSTAIANFNATRCATFVADGCQPNPAPGCPVIPVYCVAGSCSDMPAASGNDASAMD